MFAIHASLHLASCLGCNWRTPPTLRLSLSVTAVVAVAQILEGIATCPKGLFTSLGKGAKKRNGPGCPGQIAVQPHTELSLALDEFQ